MAFAAHFGFSTPSSGTLHTPQLVLATKTSGGQQSPNLMESGRGLVPGEGRSLLQTEGLPVGAAIPYLSRVAGLPESLYSQGAINPSGTGIDPSAFYTLSGAPQGFSMDRSQELWKNLHHQSPVLYPIDPMLATHPYGAFYGGFDLNNAARRKNATRETTSALKAWLYEHRKNPYPTKGEKIMLAIITKMTLTQVSTWFANARRRLKKESKIGWSKDKDIDDNDDSDVDVDDGRLADESDEEGKDRIAPGTSTKSSQEDDDEDVRVTSDISDISDTENDKSISSPDVPHAIQRKSLLFNFKRSPEASLIRPHPYHPPHTVVTRAMTSHTVSNQNNSKPKIWSIAEIMNSANKDEQSAGDNATVTGSHSNNRTTSLSRDQCYSSKGNGVTHIDSLPSSSDYHRSSIECTQGKALNLSMSEKEKVEGESLGGNSTAQSND